MLLRQCRTLLDRARSRDEPTCLTEARAFYALERRVREYLEAKKQWGIDQATSPLERQSFLLMREMLAFLVDLTTG
ncbi:hypothetical protein AMJ85_08385, partial [candidate division BRC1 bacterium SM23_51]